MSEGGAFLKLLSSHDPVIVDGAMGTLLLERGFHFPFETLNLTRPQMIKEIHGAYVATGARLILTHTFGANPQRWQQLSGNDDWEQINRAAVVNAQAAAREDALVVGNIGPSGIAGIECAQSRESLIKNFKSQACVLLDAGVTALWLETFTNFVELTAAVDACASALFRDECRAKKISPESLIACVSPTCEGALLDGTPLSEWAAFLEAAPVAVIGINCADQPVAMREVVSELSGLTSKPLALKCNAGIPEKRGDRLIYPLDAAAFASQVVALKQSYTNLKILGGCCGTTPEYIRILSGAFAP